MTIKQETKNGVVILRIEGKILIGEGDELLRQKINTLVQEGKVEILVNLARCPYMDQVGLGEIVRCFTTVDKCGGHLKLSNLKKRFRDLLSVTKLLTTFETFSNEEEAVKSFA